MRVLRFILPIALLCGATPVFADNLTVTKTATVISDPMGGTRSIPNAVVDYKLVLTNPVGNLTKPVRNMVVEDVLATNVAMRVSDLAGANKGPVEYTDGGVLGLLASGMTLTYTALNSGTDGIDFYDGTSWGYTPIADADGYDVKVRAIRVKPLTTFTTLGSFQLRYRVKIR